MKTFAILFWTFEKDNWELKEWVDDAESKEALLNDLSPTIRSGHIVEIREL